MLKVVNGKEAVKIMELSVYCDELLEMYIDARVPSQSYYDKERPKNMRTKMVNGVPFMDIAYEHLKDFFDRDEIEAAVREMLRLQTETDCKFFGLNKGQANISGTYIQNHLLGSKKSQRNIHKRIDELGIEESDITDKTILDLGSFHGGMLFWASQFKPSAMLGVEVDEYKYRLTRKIAAFANIPMEVVQADLNDYIITNKYDTVFCLAIIGHLRNSSNLYKQLYDITNDVLFLEGNKHTDPEKIEERLREAGFTNIEYRGRSTDDGLGRPIFKCRKD